MDYSKFKKCKELAHKGIKKVIDSKQSTKATAFIGCGALAGVIKGGALGVATAGVGMGVPIWAAGTGGGLAIYGAYKLWESYSKGKAEEREKERKRQKRAYRIKVVSLSLIGVLILLCICYLGYLIFPYSFNL